MKAVEGVSIDNSKLFSTIFTASNDFHYTSILTNVSGGDGGDGGGGGCGGGC